MDHFLQWIYDLTKPASNSYTLSIHGKTKYDQMGGSFSRIDLHFAFSLDIFSFLFWLLLENGLSNQINCKGFVLFRPHVSPELVPLPGQLLQDSSLPGRLLLCPGQVQWHGGLPRHSGIDPGQGQDHRVGRNLGVLARSHRWGPWGQLDHVECWNLQRVRNSLTMNLLKFEMSQRKFHRNSIIHLFLNKSRKKIRNDS